MNKRLAIWYFLMLGSFAFEATAQGLAAYTDLTNRFQVFDQGITNEIEFMPVQDWQVGGHTIAYHNQQGRFKIYHNGTIVDTKLGGVSEYKNTDHLLFYRVHKVIYVYDREKQNSYPVCNWAKQYSVGDSVIAYLDEIESKFSVYYKGKSQVLERLNGGRELRQMITGDNVVAYLDGNYTFKVFYRDYVDEVLYNVNQLDMKAARNTVGFIDPNTDAFEVYHKGNIYHLEDFPPQSYQVGDDLVAYFDFNDNFKIFYNGKIFKISNNEPAFYKVTDQIVVYEQNGTFHAFADGKEHVIEKNYVPDNYQLQLNRLAYIDRYGELILFSEGTKKKVYSQNTSSFELIRDAILIQTGGNFYQVFWDDKLYK